MKETKVKETKKRDPIFEKFNASEWQDNRLALPQSLKEYLKEQGLDWKFINAREFRDRGNNHQGYWVPYPVPAELQVHTTPERMILRGDLVLAVRPKAATKKYRDRLDARNRANANFNKEKAKELKQMAREAHVGDQVQVHEGYEEGEKGFGGGSED